jgi:lysine-specific demethylase/histidyl-hydroxylase NO66
MDGLARAQTQSAAEDSATPPSWREDSLGFLMAPVGRPEFLDRFYEQAPLLNARSEPERFAELLTLDMLDAFIASADLREGMIELTNKKNPLTRDDYVLEDGRVSQTAVAREYLRGATIILPHLHESLFQLGEFSRSLEEIFSCHVQTNIYLTPSGNQGFPPHYDNHDVFVMQISGRKAWRLYGTPVATPYRGERFRLDTHIPSEVTQEFTIAPGDCVYIPRGLMHDAENVGEEPSLHITVGLITKTWADLLLEAVSELALEEPAFRR